MMTIGASHKCPPTHRSRYSNGSSRNMVRSLYLPKLHRCHLLPQASSHYTGRSGSSRARCSQQCLLVTKQHQAVSH